MIFALQVDLSTTKTPIDFQTERSKDASAAAILMRFRAKMLVSDHYLEFLMNDLHDIRRTHPRRRLKGPLMSGAAVTNCFSVVLVHEGLSWVIRRVVDKNAML